MSWNKVCPPKTWASRLHHEVMNIGRSHEATVIVLPRHELPVPSFDIAKSSTASWLQCAFGQCPVGRCLPAPESRLVPAKKEMQIDDLCQKGRSGAPTTKVAQQTALFSDIFQPLERFRAARVCQPPFCRLLRGLFDFWLLVWGVASCPFRAADCMADVSRRTWSAWEIWSSTIRRSKRGVNYSLVNCARSKIVRCIYHCLACIDVLFGLWLLISEYFPEVLKRCPGSLNDKLSSADFEDGMPFTREQPVLHSEGNLSKVQFWIALQVLGKSNGINI